MAQATLVTSVVWSTTTPLAGQVVTARVTLTSDTNQVGRTWFTISSTAGFEGLSFRVISGYPATNPWGAPTYTQSGSFAANLNSEWSFSGAPYPTAWVVEFTMRSKPGVTGRQNIRIWANSWDYSILSQSNVVSTDLDVSASADPTVAPTAPSGLSATAGGATTATVTWTDNSTGELYFSLQRSLTQNGAYSEVAKVPSNTTTFTDTGLSAETTYWYKVAAANAYGLSAFSNTDDATTSVAPTVPNAPTGLSATATGSDIIELSWTDASSNETEFSVYRSTVSGSGFVGIATLAPGSTTFTDTGLQPSATYYYKVAASNTAGEALSSEASATTAARPTTIVPEIGLTHNADANIDMAEVDGRVIIVSDLDRPIVEENNRAYWAGLKPHRTAPTVTNSGAGALTGVFTAYTMLVRKEVGDTRSNPSPASTATASLSSRVLTIIPQGNRAFNVAGATQATPIVITTNSAHGLSTGAQVYIENVGGNTAANGVWTITVTGSTTFSLTGSVGNAAYTSGGTVSTEVACRDRGVSSSGEDIAGANFWEVYLHEQNMDRPVRVETLPLTTLSYTTPSDLTVVDLQDGTRRPMEVLLENTIPPAVSRVEYHNNRVHYFGERTIKPSDADVLAGASITVTRASNTVTCSNYEFTDALYHKELYINRNGTGWFVVDVVSETEIEIAHADPDINEKGYDGDTASYKDFMFPAKPRRVYRSGYYSGEAQGGQTFSPETCPPTNIMESELPFNERNPTGAITSKDVLMLFSDDISMYLRGGLSLDGASDGSDFPTPTVIGNDGLLARNSLARDSQGNVWGINSQGVFRANQAGIQKVGTMANHAFMFQRWYDVGKARTCVAEWFGRDDQLVVVGLTANGSTTDGLDGVIYDSRTGYICPFNTTSPMTFLLATPTDSGAIQLIYGNAFGEYGVALQQGIYTDDVDYTSATPFANETAYTCSVTSGMIAADRAITIKRFWPHVDQTPLTTAVTVTVAIDKKKRNDNAAASFSADVSKTFTTSGSASCYSMRPIRCQRAKVRLSFPTSRSERLEWSGLQMEGVYHGADA